MILYSYICENSECSTTEFDAFNKIDQRETSICPECAALSRQRVTAARLDYLGMGVSTSLPTAADKWAKMQTAKNSGKMKDANNDRYGGAYLKD